MPVTLIPSNIIFGTHEPKQPFNIPVGAKWKIRMRPDDFARCFVRRNGTISEHRIRLVDGDWMLDEPHSINHGN
jgi:hypothetical protein